MKALTIGVVARAAGVGVETVRFYQREGLISVPPRRQAGYRQYSLEAVGRIRFIRHARGLGFSLREIRELLALQAHPDQACGQVKQRTEAKIEEIDTKLRDLQAMRKVLVGLTTACTGVGRVSQCSILKALEDRQSS